MKNLLFISLGCLLFPACRSSYDEKSPKPEVKSSAEIQANPPSEETPNIPDPKPQTPVTDNPVQGGSDGQLPVVDPATIMTQHEATAEELTKYNCKGTALITDTGMDDNKDGTLQYEEIQETRIDCTEVVPGH